jgi:adenylate cyclase
MSSIILQSQGIVDKYIGDAVMAFWNAPIPLRDHATVACSVALKSQHRLADLRKSKSDQLYISKV